MDKLIGIMNVVECNPDSGVEIRLRYYDNWRCFVYIGGELEYQFGFDDDTNHVIEWMKQSIEQKDETPGKDYNTCTDTLYRCPKCFRYNTAPSGCLSCS
jgi:hypothetical protein